MLHVHCGSFLYNQHYSCGANWLDSVQDTCVNVNEWYVYYTHISSDMKRERENHLYYTLKRMCHQWPIIDDLDGQIIDDFDLQITLMCTKSPERHSSGKHCSMHLMMFSQSSEYSDDDVLLPALVDLQPALTCVCMCVCGWMQRNTTVQHLMWRNQWRSGFGELLLYACAFIHVMKHSVLWKHSSYHYGLTLSI
jgi:hypothetical protein